MHPLLYIKWRHAKRKEKIRNRVRNMHRITKFRERGKNTKRKKMSKKKNKQTRNRQIYPDFGEEEKKHTQNKVAWAFARDHSGALSVRYLGLAYRIFAQKPTYFFPSFYSPPGYLLLFVMVSFSSHVLTHSFQTIFMPYLFFISFWLSSRKFSPVSYFCSFFMTYIYLCIFDIVMYMPFM